MHLPKRRSACEARTAEDAAGELLLPVPARVPNTRASKRKPRRSWKNVLNPAPSEKENFVRLEALGRSGLKSETPAPARRIAAEGRVAAAVENAAVDVVDPEVEELCAHRRR